MNSERQLPTIALTMGDPAGVGPELIVALLNDPEMQRLARYVVFGDARILKQCADHLQISQPDWQVLSAARLLADRFEWNGEPGPFVVSLESIDLSNFQPGRVAADCGKAAFAFIQLAIDAALDGKVDAITTAPINKEALRDGGINFPGHTEMFAARADADAWCMMQYSEEITCSFVTVHVGYAEVPSLLSTESVLQTIRLTDQALRRIRGGVPKIVVCGLNPHAGENGLFGSREEEHFIIPAIELARSEGIQLEGPLPPDTAFLPWKRAETDGFVCMYHDQGHIPVKALAFDSAVNTTIGLDLIRTSVDHGTAFDIAWQGKARVSSLQAAVRLACKLAAKK